MPLGFVAANGDETEMIGAPLRPAPIGQFLLQAMQPRRVSVIGDRLQLRAGVAASHDPEPLPQVLLEADMLVCQRHRRKPGPFHDRSDRLGRPEKSCRSAM